MVVLQPFTWLHIYYRLQMDGRTLIMVSFDGGGTAIICTMLLYRALYSLGTFSTPDISQ